MSILRAGRRILETLRGEDPKQRRKRGAAHSVKRAIAAAHWLLDQAWMGCTTDGWMGE